MSKIAIIYHSIYGHTKLQAEAVFRGAQSMPTITAQLYTAEEATRNDFCWSWDAAVSQQARRYESDCRAGARRSQSRWFVHRADVR